MSVNKLIDQQIFKKVDDMDLEEAIFIITEIGVIWMLMVDQEKFKIDHIMFQVILISHCKI